MACPDSDNDSSDNHCDWCDNNDCKSNPGSLSLEHLKRRLSDGCWGSRCAVTRAADLAHQGLLGSVEKMKLYGYNLSSVPAKHLIALTSSLTQRIGIWKVSGCDLVAIMDSLKCEEIEISDHVLSSEETRALIRALDSRVKVLAKFENVTLDHTVLNEASGIGKEKVKRSEHYWRVKNYNEHCSFW